MISYRKQIPILSHHTPPPPYEFLCRRVWQTHKETHVAWLIHLLGPPSLQILNYNYSLERKGENESLHFEIFADKGKSLNQNLLHVHLMKTESIVSLHMCCMHNGQDEKKALEEIYLASFCESVN